MRTLRIVSCSLLALWSPRLPAQIPYLVADIDTTARGTKDASPLHFTTLGSHVLFTADSGGGRGLFGLDRGTGAITSIGPNGLVVDSGLVKGPKAVYFFGTLGTTRYLFVSNGTTPGTQSIGVLPQLAHSLTLAGKQLFFAATDPTAGEELFVSDGISKISLVTDIRKGSAGSSPSHLTASGDVLFFTADDGAAGGEPWRSMGTAATTKLVADVEPGSAGSFPGFYATHYDTANRRHSVVFRAKTKAHGAEPWVSDGTSSGTRHVADIVPGTGSSNSIGFYFDPTKYLWYFTATTSAHGTELWKTDLKSGTALVKDIRTGAESSNAGVLGGHRGRIFFIADDGFHGRELWVTDGTAAKTTIVRDILPGSGSGLGPGLRWAFDGTGTTPRLYLGLGKPWRSSRLWMSDGTKQGTRLLRSFCTHSKVPDALLALPGGGVVFKGDDGIHGTEVWISDDTASGTKMVRDLRTETNPGITRDSNPRAGRADVGKLYFAASQAGQGDKVWASDGRSLTLMGPAPGARDLIRMEGGAMYHTVLDSLQRRRLQQVKSPIFASPAKNVRNLTVVGDKLFYSGWDPIHGDELWVLGGGKNGLVANLRSGRASSNPVHITPFRDGVCFIADRALWLSDGTAAGTTKLKDGDARGPIVVVGERLFFNADDPGLKNGRELWASDGTKNGTTLVKDINPGTAGSWPLPKIALGDTLLFTAVHPTSGRELWKSDGTAAGTVLLKDIYPGTKSTVVQHATLATDRVFFSAFTPKNHQLFVTDGTTAGTIMVTPGVIGARPDNIVATGRGKVYFAANSHLFGREIWKSNGTKAGTAVVYDFRPDKESSNPELLGIIESDRIRLLFAADNCKVGRELFAIDIPSSARDVGRGCAYRRQPPRFWVDPTLSPLFTIAEFGAAHVRPNSSVFVLLSTKPLSSLPFFDCAFHVDSSFIMHGPYKTTNGVFRDRFFVKADPSHIGLQAAWQGAAWPAPGWRGFDLTNGVITTFAK